MGSVGHKISMELDVDYTNTKSELGISKYMYYSFFFIIQFFAFTTEVKKIILNILVNHMATNVTLAYIFIYAQMQ